MSGEVLALVRLCLACLEKAPGSSFYSRKEGLLVYRCCLMVALAIALVSEGVVEVLSPFLVAAWSSALTPRFPSSQ
jgi:hypothetical protein